MSIDNPTLFATAYVPPLWTALLRMYGQTVTYTPAGEDPVVIEVVWKEGAENEPTSPGSYSNITLCDAELGQTPVKGDVVGAMGASFDVVVVDAYAIGYSRCVLKEQT